MVPRRLASSVSFFFPSLHTHQPRSFKSPISASLISDSSYSLLLLAESFCVHPSASHLCISCFTTSSCISSADLPVRSCCCAVRALIPACLESIRYISRPSRSSCPLSNSGCSKVEVKQNRGPAKARHTGLETQPSVDVVLDLLSCSSNHSQPFHHPFFPTPLPFSLPSWLTILTGAY